MSELIKTAVAPSISVAPGDTRTAGRVVRLPGKAGRSLCRLVGRLRFKHLALLVALDEHRNLHRAAKAVHLAQPSASQLVHDLEVLFGSGLFDRRPTGMQPTKLGTVVLAFANRALSDLKRLDAELAHRQAGRDSHFVIGTATDILPGAVALAMAEMKQRRPTLALELLADGSDNKVIDRLIEGQTDLAMGYFRNDQHESEVDYEVIGKEVVYMVARRHHPVSLEAHLSANKLENAAWILQTHPGSLGQLFKRVFRRMGMKEPANVVNSNSLNMTLGLVLTSDAITILPESIVRQHLQSGQLVALPVAAGDCFIEFGILSRQRTPRCPAALEFSELLRHVEGGAERHRRAQALRR